ncbi:MAG: hypothetical protein NTY46_03245 [Candidatus Sumerlaeota bacterium]|nr:hypothetical protein [Candidatus Sumerlaeota bacterium]
MSISEEFIFVIPIHSSHAYPVHHDTEFVHISVLHIKIKSASTSVASTILVDPLAHADAVLSELERHRSTSHAISAQTASPEPHAWADMCEDKTLAFTRGQRIFQA